MPELLRIENYKLMLHENGATFCAIQSTDLSVKSGEVVALIGESGSGKSMLWKSLLGLTAPDKWENSGRFWFKGKEMILDDKKSLAQMRGREIAVVMQDTVNSFDQLFTIEQHFLETARTHTSWKKEEITQKAVGILRNLNVHHPEKVLKMYPFQCSGGMLQRIMIAIALLLQPDLIIADEPTTSVDVTAQREIITLLKKVNQEYGTGILFISHALKTVEHLANRIYVMYGGQLIEYFSGEEFRQQKVCHPYTKKLLLSRPAYTRDYLPVIRGTQPALKERPKGCPFAPRCEYAATVCQEFDMKEAIVSEGHGVKCLKWEELHEPT